MEEEKSNIFKGRFSKNGEEKQLYGNTRKQIGEVTEKSIWTTLGKAKADSF